MTLKPWREVAIPHEDVLQGTFQQAEFAADLSRVHDGTATPEYCDPALFYARTYITEGMRILLESVVQRISGRGGDPVIQLQTAFGGGKTHTLLAVYHLAKGAVPASELPGIPPILDAAGVLDPPKARIVVLDGTKLAPHIPQRRGSVEVRTLWGELAWQLGGDVAYAQVREADTSGTSPGKDVLARLLAAHAPCVILIDELVAYIRQFEEGKSYAGGTYDVNLSFVQALTEAIKAVPNAVLLASLPESAIEAGGERGAQVLRALEHYFGRVQALWKPVATEEAFEIVRRRLFSSIADPVARDAVCRAFAETYLDNSGQFPHETQESRYYQRLVAAYPIHPELFDRLYEDWASLENFQRTRGVLKLMAKAIYRLWESNNNDLLIMPGNLPLYDGDTRNEMIYYLPQGWDPVVERDIDGDRAETTEIENRDTRFGAVQACRRVARTIFLGSAPNISDRVTRGIERERILLGSIQPSQQIGVFTDALSRLSDRLHHLNIGNERYWFDTRPNLRREMEERKRRFNEREEILPRIRNELARIVRPGLFAGIHIFTPSSDIPDDWGMRFVVLPPDAAYGRHQLKSAEWWAAEYLKNRGEQPRQKQNRLIFLAADADTIDRLSDQARIWCAWESIVKDYEARRIILDNIMGENAREQMVNAKNIFQRVVREAYRWLLVPGQELTNGRPSQDIAWERYQINPSAQQFSQEIERILRENEVIIERWAPVHLKTLLKTWFWREGIPEAVAQEVWHKTCFYLYLPRLKDESVFKEAIVSGAGSREYFGTAAGEESGKYLDFTFGWGRSQIILDSSLLLIEPAAAAEYQKQLQKDLEGEQEEEREEREREEKEEHLPPLKKKRFYGKKELDPVNAKVAFSDLVDEVVQHFTTKPHVRVRIRIDIDAETDDEFDEALQRIVKENSNVLRFEQAQFE
ncbi:MAG: hypothetical protein PWR21_388 [Methanoculleus sp.]|nr:hypothetical protein [Methanoculleus sp.]